MTNQKKQSAKPAVLITGAADRIGRAIAQDMAAKGHPVCIHYNRSAQRARELVAALTDQGAHAICVGGDLLNSDTLGQLIPNAAETLGAPIQILVNNASIFEKDEVGGLSAALFDRHFGIHATAPALLADALVRALPSKSDALIVNIIDQRVWRLTPMFPSYTASKAALWALTQTLAQGYAELTNGRVRVNAIGPGPTLANQRQQDQDFQNQVDGIPLRKGPHLEEFAATITYLWHTKSITGQMIALDGGQHLAWQTPDVLNANE